MKLAAMQPAYWPWAGFFHLIHSADIFVFLDDAQYERASWQNRNRILLNGKPHWLTVPTIRRHLGDAINEVETDDRLGWRRKHERTVEQAYGRWPNGQQAIEIVRSLLRIDRGETLCQLTTRIIDDLCARWDINTPRYLASTLGIGGARSDRLIALCRRFGATEYVSPTGSAAYLEEDQFEARSGARLTFNPYQPQPYLQPRRDGFMSHLSVIDVIASMGLEPAGRYVKASANTEH